MKNVTEKVKKVSLVSFMKYSTNIVQDGYGIVYSQGFGYDIADLNIIGTMEIKTGLNPLNNPPNFNSIYLLIIKFFQILIITWHLLYYLQNQIIKLI